MYIRVDTPALRIEQKRALARALTDTVLHALKMPESRRSWWTVQFVSFDLQDLAIGGVLGVDPGKVDYYLTVSAPGLRRDQKEALARELTHAIAAQLAIPNEQLYRINLRFCDYNQEDVAVGGQIVSHLAA